MAALPRPTTPDPAGATDPVLARRARIARLAELGRRLGAGLYAVSVVAFVAGYAAGYTTPVVRVVVYALVVGSVLLAPAMVAGYAVRAAEREEAIAGAASAAPTIGGPALPEGDEREGGSAERGRPGAGDPRRRRGGPSSSR